MFTSRDFLRGVYNVLSKNVTRDVSQSEKTLSEVIYNKSYCFNKMKNKQNHTVGPIPKPNIKIVERGNIFKCLYQARKVSGHVFVC